ncbi:MAG: ABC transporter ATP-binding protein [Pirellulales bacterium]|jgi:cobalt/nickel transport system ATP-binding protein|nr:ABC transporter ATP-binding protein [Thermoguttaceae bacterium]MDD4787274.1 ABC transporter ATP-binding protein [Pirellulales bacterium]MDI9443682.1 ABC transporter ATP-binding protein [Planctomycetota bacterium]NLY99998.1 ABC transporter ATP-binding protein [Pirellulaceae bacterium]
MSDPLVKLDRVTFRYGERTVLDQCDLALAAGERVGLVGANGSGKTTLLGLIVGLRRPAQGRVIVFGKPREREADFRPIRGRVGLLFQDSDDQLFCPTVAEDVAFGPFNLGKSRHEVEQIVARTLGELGLEDYAHRVTYKLSGGEKRLVALATVLAMEPEVLLLDEPTAGLDETAAERVAGILAGLPQAMLIVSHDRPFLARIADRRLCLRRGCLQEPL